MTDAERVLLLKLAEDVNRLSWQEMQLHKAAIWLLAEQVRREAETTPTEALR